MQSVLEVSDLTARITTSTSVVQALGGVSFTLGRGEMLGLVGESGSGKSITGLSIMGLLPPGGIVAGGSVKLEGKTITGLPERELERIRGNDISMVFQDSLSSLNPTKTVGWQVSEGVRLHLGLDRTEATERAIEALTSVGVPNPRERLDYYPHQLSGGLRQRVMIAMALVCEPKVLIADEPTTALDVTIQAQILELLDRLREERGMSIILVTHDMGVVAGRADRVSVMYAGKIVETAETRELFARAEHPYTRALLSSIPRLEQDATRKLFSIPGFPPDLSDPPPGCRFAARCGYATERCVGEEPRLVGVGHSLACWHPVETPVSFDAESEGYAKRSVSAEHPALELKNVVKEFHVSSSLFKRGRVSVKAVSDVSVSIAAGEMFGLVGESGCGKTTLGRLIVGLEQPDSGSVWVDGRDMESLSRAERRAGRRDLQMMFQDPYGSLDPRMLVGDIIAEPLVAQGVGDRESRHRTVAKLLEQVGLPATAAKRYPHEFSGGQRQRIGLARAVALTPRVVVADEPVSALDVSIRSQVLNLMKSLQADLGMACIVISHDLAVVKYLADRVGVMYLGKLVELATPDDLYTRAAHPYTAGLISAIPVPDPDIERAKHEVAISGELPSPMNPPSGCRFRSRCPRAQALCASEEPELRTFGEGHLAACHFPLVEAIDTVTARTDDNSG